MHENPWETWDLEQEARDVFGLGPLNGKQCFDLGEYFFGFDGRIGQRQ